MGGKAVQAMIKGTFDPWNYAVDRITRIWVPLIPALVLSAFLAWIFGGLEYGPWAWLCNLLGLQRVATGVDVLAFNVPLWSLGYEIWFYCLTFAIGRQVIRKSADLPALILIAASALVFSKLSVVYLACWLVGAVFYLKPHHIRPWYAFALAGLLASLSTAGLHMTGTGTAASLPAVADFGPALDILLAIAAGVLCVVLVDLPPSRISALGVPLSAFSYTLYLTHYPVLHVLQFRSWKRLTYLDSYSFVLFGAAICVCLSLAWLIYWLFERNTRKLRTFIKRNLMPTPETALKSLVSP